MEKRLVSGLVGALMVLAVAGNALALINYQENEQNLSGTSVVNQANELAITNYSWTLLNPEKSFIDVALTLTGTTAPVLLGGVYPSAIASTPNSAPLTFTLSGMDAPTNVTGLNLTGTLAPEAISLALVGAGLVGLPFARRLRKALKA